MSLPKNQSGFSAVELVILLVIVGALAFVTYTVYNRQQDNEASKPQTSQTSVASDAANNAPEIKSSGDLDKASSNLDDISFDDTTDSTQLDSELSAF